MFAQLTYGAGAPIANVLADIAVALTGGGIGDMSGSLNAGSSSIDNGPGGAASWTFVSDASNLISDSNAFTSGVTSYGAKVFSQPATTSFGAPDKFLKIGFGAFSSTVPGTAIMISYLGKGNSGGTILNGIKTGSAGGYHCCNAAGDIASSAFTQAMRFQIYSSPTATLINAAQGDLFSFYPTLCVMDFALASPDMEQAGNICTVLTNGNVGNNRSGVLTQHRNPIGGYIPVTTVNGKAYGTGTSTVANNRTLVHIGTPEIANVIPHLLTPDYKYEGFNKIGTKYDLFNIGITKFFFYNGESASQVYYTTPLMTKQIPYSSITDVTGVYACHEEAFGNNGNFYQTPLGTMCKFGIFMVEV